MGLYNPWADLAEVDVTVVFEYHPGELGAYSASTRTIRLDPKLDQAERRSVLTHERIHLERGHVGCQPRRVENSVAREAARRLIKLTDLISALLTVESWDEAADEMHCRREDVETRLASLHPSEKAALRRALARREGAA
jgi:hypothetical protein